MVKKLTHQEDLTIKTYVLLTTTWGRNWTELKEQIELKYIVFGEFSTLLLVMDRTTTKKIIKEMECLNNTIKHQDLTDIYTAFHPTKAA